MRADPKIGSDFVSKEPWNIHQDSYNLAPRDWLFLARNRVFRLTDDGEVETVVTR
jgi:hypothetical protein